MKSAIALLLLVCLSAQGMPHSRVQRAAFQKAHPCPANGKMRGACPGFVVDHIWPLACGGEDHPRNMQWQTVADGKVKDRWERKMCGPTT